MNYTQFGNTGEKISRLGFGAMRLPGRKDDDSKLDLDQSVELLHRAYKAGVNYVDTAYTYRGGQSEEAVGESLKGISEKILVGSKFPLSDNPKTGDYRKKLEISLKRLHREQIDFYYFHAVERKAFDEVILKQHLLEEALKAKEEGLIRHISFSFHDKPEEMKYIIDRGEIFEGVLCQYNILHRQNYEAMSYAKSKGLGVAVMGPLAGGKFVVSDEAIQHMSHTRTSSTAEIGLRFAFNNPYADVVLSGMKNMQMLEENIQIASKPTAFTQKEEQMLEQMIEENKILGDCYCTECCYCLPCPMGINIPYIFRLLNLDRADHLTAFAKTRFAELQSRQDKQITIFSTNMGIGNDPKNCISCGKCIQKCPQKLNIPERLKEAIQRFS